MSHITDQYESYYKPISYPIPEGGEPYSLQFLMFFCLETMYFCPETMYFCLNTT